MELGTGPQLPDVEMHRWVRAGMRNIDILRTLQNEFNVHVTPSAISAWKKRHGYQVRSSTPERLALIPWRVKQEDAGHQFYKALASEARRRAGRKLLKPDRDRLNKVLRWLEEQDQDIVISYDRVNGWQPVPRRKGVDTDLIRDPRVAADGSPIEDPELWQ